MLVLTKSSHFALNATLANNGIEESSVGLNASFTHGNEASLVQPFSLASSWSGSSKPAAAALLTSQHTRGCSTFRQDTQSLAPQSHSTSVPSLVSTKSRLMNWLQVGQYILLMAWSSALRVRRSMASYFFIKRRATWRSISISQHQCGRSVKSWSAHFRWDLMHSTQYGCVQAKRNPRRDSL